MKKLVIITVLILCAATLQAAQLYYQFPTAKALKPSDRIMIYQNSSSNRQPVFGKTSSANITGATLKRDINTNPVLIAPYGNYSDVNFGRYSSNGIGLDRSPNYTTGPMYMYFKGTKLVISPKAP